MNWVRNLTEAQLHNPVFSTRKFRNKWRNDKANQVYSTIVFFKSGLRIICTLGIYVSDERLSDYRHVSDTHLLCDSNSNVHLILDL